MIRILSFTLVGCFIFATSVAAQQKKKTKPDINKSKEYKNVIHSPSAETTPTVFRSIFQLEVIVKKGDGDSQIQYSNGVLLSDSGLLATVLDMPNSNSAKRGGIEGASVVHLGGKGTSAKLLAYDGEHGVALFQAEGITGRPFDLSKQPMVTNRKLNWHAVYRNGQKTILYTRPLRVSKSKHEIGKAKNLCEVIDFGTSALTAERAGSALLALDGSLVALMGYQPHWTVTPKNSPNRRKVAWAVPSQVIRDLVEKASKP